MRTETAAPANSRCRHCGEPVRVDPGTLPASMRKAVHATTGSETGPDGHLAAPMDQPAGSMQ